MARVTLYRCTVPHFQGDQFIQVGTVLPEGSPQVIPMYFEAEEHEVDDPKPKKKTT